MHGDGGGSKVRWVERGEKGRIQENLGELVGGMVEGWKWEQGVNILIKEAILGFARDFILVGFPGPRRGSQIISCAAEERVPELVLSHSHTDEHFTYHHRTFIWRWMEIETETHIGALD